MKFVKKIAQSQLFAIASWNSFSVVLKIGIGLVTSKILAVCIGPSGMALVGNLRIFITSLENIITLGFQNGVVKEVAQTPVASVKFQKIKATVVLAMLLVTTACSGVLYVFSDFWNTTIFGKHFDYSLVFKILALTLPCHGLSVFLVAFLNGLSHFKKVIWITIIGNVIGLLTSVFLIVRFQTTGALLAIIIAPALLFFVSFYFVNKEFSFFRGIRWSHFDVAILKDFSSYTLMTFFSAVVGPLVFLAIRKNVIANIGLEQAGYWETMSRISSYYMLFATTLLSVYFLPKLAKAPDNKATKIIFWSYYKSILPVFAIGLALLYFARFFVIELLFTKAFLPVNSLFLLQIIADLLKVIFLILGYQFYAKKQTLAFILSEISSLAVLYFLSLYFIPLLGIQGVLWAQVLDNLIYLLILAIYFRKSLF